MLFTHHQQQRRFVLLKVDADINSYKMKNNNLSIKAVSFFLFFFFLFWACGEQEQKQSIEEENDTSVVAATTDIEPGLGAQLWMFRKEIIFDLPGTLQKIKDLGFDRIEAYNANYMYEDPARFKAITDSIGLEIVALHWNDMEAWRDDPDYIMDIAKTLGAKDVGIAWLKEEYELPVTNEDVVQAADILMENCSKARAKGLGLYYHIHGYEFQPKEEENTLFFDDFMERIDSNCVQLELDIFWTVYAGQDPLEMFERYGEDITMLHLKNMAEGVETGPFTGVNFSPPFMEPDQWVPLGKGQIDFNPILKKAHENKVQWYFLEMDHAGDVFEDAKTSIEYLKAEGFLRSDFASNS